MKRLLISLWRWISPRFRHRNSPMGRLVLDLIASDAPRILRPNGGGIYFCPRSITAEVIVIVTGPLMSIGAERDGELRFRETCSLFFPEVLREVRALKAAPDAAPAEFSDEAWAQSIRSAIMKETERE